MVNITLKSIGHNSNTIYLNFSNTIYLNENATAERLVEVLGDPNFNIE